MGELEIEIPMPDGTCQAVVFLPVGKSGEQWPGVLYLTDIGGIRAANRDSARRLANQGYAVLEPNVFYHTDRIPIEPPFRSLPPEDMKRRIAELSAPLTPQTMERDLSLYLDFLAAQPFVRPGKMGVVGYCFTGKMAMHAAAARPDKIASAASFHGGGLYTDQPTSPHLTLPRIKAQLYFGHATNDRSMPAEAIEKLEAALKQWGGKYQSEVYEGAAHSWTMTDSPVYNHPQAERAFQKLVELQCVVWTTTAIRSPLNLLPLKLLLTLLLNCF